MKYSLAIHGGAGTITKDQLTISQAHAYENSLSKALEIGEYYLRKGGSALDAVEFAVKCLEDDPLFNAGKGAVFNHSGKNDMEASIMDGKHLLAGAVANVRNIKNPIQLSRTIMEKSEYVYMCGEGAELFANKNNIMAERDEYFFTQNRFDQLKAIQNSNQTVLDHTLIDNKFGTVGAVALDSYGNLAAATSTGGLTNKRYGRLGDTSVIGAGTYANNNTCAVSCTGYGEYFLRAVVAHDISCLIEYKGMSLKAACEYVVHDKLVKLGGEGGLIAIDKLGNIELVFNSMGMYRGSLNNEQKKHFVAIYGNE